MSQRARRIISVALMCLGLSAAGRAHADSWVAPFRGHLGVGWTKLFTPDAPAGSLSFGTGIDYPVRPTVRLGIDVGYDLLGSRIVEQGSLVADLNYSAIELFALAHWQPSWAGPIGRISAGPGVVAARVTQSSSGAASFESFTVDEVAGALAGSVTLMSRHPAPVRVGLEIDGRYAWLSDTHWPLFGLKLVVHY